MTHPPFGSLEDWKSALMTLPDASFFELMRSVFGNIKTPFSKHRLLEDLAAFLSREEIRKAVSDYVDERDALIMAAVAALSGPLPGELESFFAGELSLAAFQDALINLEERFIIYRLREGDRCCLALNPVLEPVLAPFIAGASLFPSLPLEGPPPQPAQDDRFLGALVSFTLEEAHFFRSEGKFRKRVLDSGNTLFPGLDLERSLGGFTVLGLLRAEGEDLIPDREMLAAFGDISPRERLEYWAAGIRVYEDPEAPRGNFFRGSVHLCRASVRKTFRLIHRFFNLLEKERRYPLSTLLRYWSILIREERGRPQFEELRGIFETTGLLCPAGETWTAGPVFHEAGPDRGPCLVMDTPGSWFLYPGISFADSLDLAFFSVIRETGTVVRMELTRESAVRGFDHGYTAEGILGILRRLSGGRVNETLAWTLRDWEKRYGEVALYSGVVLTLEEDRRYLAGTEPVLSLIQRVLAPGVYLLDGAGTEEAAEALRQAGVDIVARRNAGRGPRTGVNAPAAGTEGGPSPGGGRRNFFPPAEAVFSGGESWGAAETSAGGRDEPPENVPAPSPSPAPPGEAAGEDRRREGREKRLEQLQDRLAAMPLGRAERDELSARIRRRLVLSESQLEGASVRYEKREARFLDYAGKASIAKQAIASKSLLEVHWPHPEKGTMETIGIPTALEKSGGESILVISPGDDPARKGSGEAARVSGNTQRIPGEFLRIPLGKISLMRRIKKSIFGD
ncbi:MAG: helicase-associated domain-containing protein [Treponema sp.]|jgi:hypothetical protein|nr:helicase-associated domain-containing protein [Treponema sp.]